MNGDALGPVRLVTGESTPTTPVRAESSTSIAGWATVGVGLTIALVVAAFQARSWWHARSATGHDAAAAKMLARRLGLSKQDHALLSAMAQGDDSPLDLLVSVKKLSIAAARHAGTLSSAADRSALADLCRALGADVPEALSKSSLHIAGTRQPPAGGRRPPRASVVSPRLIDRRG